MHHHKFNIYTAWPKKKSRHLALSYQIGKSLLLDNYCMGNYLHHFHTWIGHHRVQTFTPLRIFGMCWRRLFAVVDKWNYTAGLSSFFRSWFLVSGVVGSRPSKDDDDCDRSKWQMCSTWNIRQMSWWWHHSKPLNSIKTNSLDQTMGES